MLKVKDVVAGYEKSVVVNDVSIKVGDSEVVTIVGPNGSGKSTLLKAIVGQARIFDGRILYGEEEITNLRTDLIIKKGIGYVPQVDNVFVNLSVEENLEMGGYLLKENLEETMSEVLSLFPELRRHIKRKVSVLSGGERQMLAIARALMSNPKMLIVDEPTANLAPRLVAKVLAKIREIVESGYSVLMVEQNAKKALDISDYCYILASGKLVFEGEPKEVLAHEEFGKIYLGLRSHA
jgi:ABC-type branched-subunit amino acid transport system ATPase component